MDAPLSLQTSGLTDVLQRMLVEDLDMIDRHVLRLVNKFWHHLIHTTALSHNLDFLSECPAKVLDMVLKREKRIVVGTEESAAEENSVLPFFEFFRKLGFSFSESTLKIAAKNGHFSVVKYLLEIGCPLNNTCNSYACKGGHIEIVKWLHKR